MKSKNSIQLVVMIFISLLLISCSTSVKGNWSDSDKQKFQIEMEAVEELSDLGENKTKWIECYLIKCEANFSSFYQADSDAKGCEKIALECYDEVLSNGSVKGNWSDSDKLNFYLEMQTVEELSDLGEDKSKWIECYLNKCEANFSSLYEADSDEESLEKIALECYDEVLSNGSVKGNWSDTDKLNFYLEMQTVEELSALGGNKSKWIECYLNKCEANFSSLYEADSDEESLEKIALECFSLIM